MKAIDQVKWSTLIVGVLYLNYVGYDKFLKPQMSSYWNQEQPDSRSPASNEPVTGVDLNLPDLSILDDYFLHDTFKGYVKYDMDVSMWSDKGDQYFKKKILNALDSGLKKSFKELVDNNKDGDKTLTGEAKSHVIKSLLKELLLTHKFHKIIDANFEIDFTFTPKNNNYSHYRDELKSNQLVDMNSKDTLVEEFNKFNQNPMLKYTDIKLPSTGHMYQYIGGAITITSEILDTTINPLKPIPNPKKNAVKGHVRLRKYYRINTPNEFDLSGMLSSNKITNFVTSFSQKEGFKSHYITVDTIFDYNLKNILPVKKKVEIYPGQLLSLDKTHDNIIKRAMQVFDKSNHIKSSVYKISGDYNSTNARAKFEAIISKITHDFASSKTSFSTRLRTLGPNNGSNFDVKRELNKSLFNNENKMKDVSEKLDLATLIESKKI